MSHVTYQKSRAHFNLFHLRDKALTLKGTGVALTIFVFCLVPCLVSAQGQQCVRQNPTVTISPAVQSGFAGQQLTFTVTVTNNDSAGCPASRFLVMPTFPGEGFMHTPDCIRFTLRPGESRSRTVVIKLPRNACLGDRVFQETAINEDVPSFSATAEARISVAPLVPDCGRANPTVIISPSSRVTVGSGIATFTVTITNNDNPACGGSVFNLAATLPEGALVQLDRRDFNLFVPAGGTESRVVFIQPSLAASGDLIFTQSATNVNAPCFRGSADAVVSIVQASSLDQSCVARCRFEFDFAQAGCTGDPFCRAESRFSFEGCLIGCIERRGTIPRP